MRKSLGMAVGTLFLAFVLVPPTPRFTQSTCAVKFLQIASPIPNPTENSESPTSSIRTFEPAGRSTGVGGGTGGCAS